MRYYLSICLCFIVEAGPPSQPNVDEITPNSVSLSWEKPTDDGGGKIKGYVVEMKKDGAEDWDEITPTPVPECFAKIPNLKEGTKAQFRVKAVNEIGPGKASRPTASLVVEKQPEAPSINLGALKDVTVKAGNDIKLAIPIKGHPPPTATFENDGVAVDGPRVKVEVRVSSVCHFFSVIYFISFMLFYVIFYLFSLFISLHLYPLAYSYVFFLCCRSLTFNHLIVIICAPFAFMFMHILLMLQVKDDQVLLVISEAVRKDTGPYTLKLRNPSGTAEGKFNVKVEGEYSFL